MATTTQQVMATNKAFKNSFEQPNTNTDGRLCNEGQHVLTPPEYFVGQFEMQEVMEWQREVFSPEKVVYKSLEEEFEQYSKLNVSDDHIEEVFVRIHEWLDETMKNGYPTLETLLVRGNGREVCILDVIMVKSDRNPILTNMDIDEYVPGMMWLVNPNEFEK